MQHHSPFTRSRSSTLQVQGVKSAVEALSTKRIASNKDATTDRSPLLRANSQAIAQPPIKPPEKAPKKKGIGFLNKLKRSETASSTTNTSPPTTNAASDIFINELQKKSIKEIQFDLIIMQIQNAQPQWIQNFTNMGGPTLLFSHLVKDNYRDDVKEKFLKCLRCLHSIIKRTNDQQNETLLGQILKNNNLEKLIRILTWTSDLFLLSSTCLTLIDISQTSTGHKNFIECLFHISKQDSNKYITSPLISALQLINPTNTSKSARICGEVVLTLYNNFLMNITDIHQRFDCENELLAQGILPLILELRNLSNLQGQLDLFEQILTTDLNEMKLNEGLTVKENDSENHFVVNLVTVEEAKPLILNYTENTLIGELLDILCVKQEYLGYSVEDPDLYGIYVTKDYFNRNKKQENNEEEKNEEVGEEIQNEEEIDPEGEIIDVQEVEGAEIKEESDETEVKVEGEVEGKLEEKVEEKVEEKAEQEEKYENYVELYDRIVLDPSKTVGEYGFTGEINAEFRLKPWTLKVLNYLNKVTEVIHVLVNPNSKVDDLLRSLLPANYVDNSNVNDENNTLPTALILSKKNLPPTPQRSGTNSFGKMEERQIEITEESEFGLYFEQATNWLGRMNKLYSYPTLAKFTNNFYLILTVKVQPVVIKFKEQSFSIEIKSNHIPIHDLYLKAIKKLELPKEQANRYSLFLDRLKSASSSPDSGLLEPYQLLSNILSEQQLDYMVLKLDIRPHWVSVNMLIDDDADPKEYKCEKLRLLLNQTVGEGKDIICAIFNVDPRSYQLLTDERKKLIDYKSFEAQQIQSDAVLYLIPYQDVDSEGAGDVNIWDEERNEKTLQIDPDNKTVYAATLNQLVRTATDEIDYDTNFMNTFIATYRSFTTPEILLQKLIERYEVPSEISSQSKKVVQSKVCVVMKRWIETFTDDEEKALIDKIQQWVSKVQTSDAPKVISGVIGSINKLKTTTDQQYYFNTKPPLPRAPKEKTFELIKFEELDMLEVARQLSLISFEMFSKIRRVELFGQAWSRPKTQHLCPNLIKLIDHFNYISKAVCCILVQESKVRQRAKLYEKLVTLAEHLRSLNNFNLLVAIISGLNSSSIGRLSWTKSRVQSRYLLIQESLEQLTSMNQSYKNYRLAEKVDPPLIPYLGVYLQDLTFIEDGNPDYVDGDLINFYKRNLVRKTLAQLETFQQQAYNFIKVPILRAYLEHLPQMDDDSIYKLSLCREPRGAKRSDIE